LSSLDLLEKYGYVEPDVENPHDDVDVSLKLALDAFRAQLAKSASKEQQDLFEDKLTFMRENGILPDPSDMMDSEEEEIAEPVGEDEIDFSIRRPSTFFDFAFFSVLCFLNQWRVVL
jgi:hypothetical protein